MELTIKLPAIALRDQSVLPDTSAQLDVSRAASRKALEKAMLKSQKIFLVAQKNGKTDAPGLDQLHSVGCIARIRQIVKLHDKMVRVLVEGTDKGRLVSVSREEGFLEADVIPYGPLQQAGDDGEDPETEELARKRTLLESFASFMAERRINKLELLRHLADRPLSVVCNVLMEELAPDYRVKQEYLECDDPEDAFTQVAVLLENERRIYKIREELRERLQQRVNDNQKEYVLREQLKVIQEELGEDPMTQDANKFTELTEALAAPEKVKETLRKEISRYAAAGQHSPDASVERVYIETLLNVPWETVSEEKTDLEEAESILNRDHYGLEKIKERILEYMAVRLMTGGDNSPILCLVGPPGTGKTSIAKSIAEALGRKYVRICLGGLRDEAEIRGHRKTYVGAMPGRIVRGLEEAGTCNPVMLLDELDKMSSDYKGDPSSAMLEVLDSEQNSHFTDHYLELPLDLSKVVFIATANDTAAIPRPLLDRMEVIELSGYTANEKFHIGREHLLPKQLKNHGLTKKICHVSDGAIRELISLYTREAGVRQLERCLGKVCRRAVKEYMTGDSREAIRITKKSLEQYAGKPLYRPERHNKKPEIGMVTGLAWTSVGGAILGIEVNTMAGKGELKLTGQMGDVMQESAQAGYTYVRSVGPEYGLAEEQFKETDIHIHIPEGAVPKDGPSAGITMATAMLSAFARIPVRADVAMTGEITLRGRVLPVGGLKEKLLAAKMAGIRTAIVPADNRRDVEELSEEIRDGMHFVYAETMEQVLKTALAR